MSLNHLLLMLLLLGQTSQVADPIHTVYDSYWKWTEIKTNWLYVLNDPDQFLQLKLIARFNGKQMPKTGPTALQIEIISNASTYKYSSRPPLVAVADGVELQIGKMEPSPELELLGMFKGGRQAGQSGINQISPVPLTAAVLSRHKLQELSAEWLVTNISWEDLTALTKASQIDWKLGDTKFSFIEIQLTRLKQFVKAVTPESGVVVLAKKKSEEAVTDKLTHTDTPSDANNTGLKETLDWLKKNIAKYAVGVSAEGGAEALSLTNFDGCKIGYEVIPQGPYNVARMIQQYSVNLKDLEPNAVEINKSDDRFWLHFATRDQQQSIKLDYRDSKTRERLSSESRPLSSGQFELKPNDIAPELKEAFRHAIKLCQ